MNFLEHLLGKRPDPTLDWTTPCMPMPDFDLEEKRFGTIQFGDPIDAAAFLGRPDQFEWTQRAYGELLYAAGGFQMDFDNGRFAYLAFFIGPDDCLPKHRALKFSQPRLRTGTTDGIRFSIDTDQEVIEQFLGVADSVDVDSDESILYYTRQDITMEFEMDGKAGRLKRWNLYPKQQGC